MDQKDLERFQKAYRGMFSRYLDLLHRRAWEREDRFWRENFLDHPRVPYVPLSQQLREAEERWARAEWFAKTADIFERAFARDVAAQEVADGLAAQAVILCERYEMEFAKGLLAGPFAPPLETSEILFLHFRSTMRRFKWRSRYYINQIAPFCRFFV